MLIEGSLVSDKTEILIEKYVQLLNSGVKGSEVLVLVQNSTLKNKFIGEVFPRLKIDSIENLRVHSFYSLVYNTVADNWAFLEDRNIYDNPVIIPNMAGLEVSQFIMKDILKQIKFKGYNSGVSLLHQMFRRYSLIVQNNLTNSDVEKRAKILKEGFSQEADLAIKKFLKETLKLRDFDYLRQSLLFNFIYQNTDYFAGVKYLIADDADEMSPICIDFIEFLSKQLTDFSIAIDSLGSSRCGYLSADKNNLTKLKNIFNASTTSAQENIQIYNRGAILFKNIKNNEHNILSGFSHESFAKRSNMLAAAIEKINLLLKNEVKPCEISIISPVIDDMLKFSLKENLKKYINLVYLSGSEKLIQNRLVKASIVILKLNTELKNTLSEFDIRIILSEFLQIPLKYCEEILKEFHKSKDLIAYDFNDNEYNVKYRKFIELINILSESEEKISEQLVVIFSELFSLIDLTKEEINKYNFFIKQISDFEKVYGSGFNKRKSEIIIQTENSIIAENPYSVLEIGTNDLIISTPQKIIDNQIKTKYQLWLDISNSNWVKADTGPLYNAWVFQKDWEKDDYTLEDNINLSKDKTARVMRKLSLCASNEIYCYSSLFDSNGVENYGGIENYIVIDKTKQAEEKKPISFNITPREDQKPALNYEKGYLGISAVPGAGKTTILLALIIKLLDKGIDAEKIYVLTYMDSAARNFRERIKTIRPNSSKLPNISTIHGLALRILKENGNYEKLGLDANFEICDDSQRSRILNEISSKLKMESKMAEEFDRAVSVFKMGGGNFVGMLNPKLQKFRQFYLQYEQTLKDNNLIDYDDMLICSVMILRQNSDILAQYQNECEYVIEDEAQDSSAIQQELISLLSGKHKNVIRCGDVNQSITATFSNADVEGFRKFITENNNVSMNCSQRCAKDIWSLANKLVETSLNNEETKNSFFEMYMQPVEGKNPKSESDTLISKIFEDDREEKSFILQTIKQTLTKHPDYTIGILLRNNYQVGEWQNLIENSGIKVITRNQCLEQKTIFKVIFALMQMILSPFNNSVIAHNYSILADCGFYKKGLEGEIEKYESPFITLNSDNIDSVVLQQFYWDLNYWMTLCDILPYEFVAKVGMQFFKSDIERSNIHLISTLVKRLCAGNNSYEYAIRRLKEVAQKPNLSGFKFFSEEDEDDKKYLAGKVQIMTMHKSKGDEFNLVFIPQMSDKNLPLTLNDTNIKSADFIESVKSLNPVLKNKSLDELKQEILSENLRLLYVAITRAKNKLIITTSLNIKNRYGKMQKSQPNVIFETILNTQYEGGLV